MKQITLAKFTKKQRQLAKRMIYFESIGDKLGSAKAQKKWMAYHSRYPELSASVVKNEPAKMPY